MRVVWWVGAALGLVLIGIGALWFLQGSNLVHIQPVMCVGDCRPVIGHQLAWQVAGGAVVLIGALAVEAARRKLTAARGSS